MNQNHLSSVTNVISGLIVDLSGLVPDEIDKTQSRIKAIIDEFINEPLRNKTGYKK